MSSIILVNAEAGMIPLAAGMVHCCVGSSPYWSLRAYEGDQVRVWPVVVYNPMPGLPPIKISSMSCALGHEPTPEAFIGHLVECYREVYRVLRDDGVCWVVIGDSSGHGTNASRQQSPNPGVGANRPEAQNSIGRNGAKAGDRCLIPHRLALALQGDGWLVRNDCVFAKVAPMPESVQGTRWERHRIKIAPGRPAANQSHLPDDGQRPGGNRGNQWGDVQNQPNAEWQPCPGCPTCDPHGGYVLRRGSWRHTRAHETVLMLTKKMNYWADGEAVREATSDNSHGGGVAHDGRYMQLSGRNDGNQTMGIVTSGRNPRSVLTPRPSSYSGQHYATYPVDLIRPLIKSSCPTRCCPECGAGWAARIDKPDMSQRPTRSDDAKTMLTEDIHISNGWAGYPKSAGQQYQEWRNANPNVVLDYRPTCACHVDEAEPPHVPGLVLDPFMGSGTTGIVAREEGVDCIGLDLSYDYLHDQARERLGFVALDEWEHGKNGTEGEPLEELPMFAGLADPEDDYFRD